MKECLEICKEEKIERAVAELLKRNGNYIESLNTYLGLIDKLDPLEILKDLYNSVKGHASGVIQSTKWDFLHCTKLKSIQEFDSLLNKSIKIA